MRTGRREMPSGELERKRDATGRGGAERGDEGARVTSEMDEDGKSGSGGVRWEGGNGGEGRGGEGYGDGCGGEDGDDGGAEVRRRRRRRRHDDSGEEPWPGQGVAAVVAAAAAATVGLLPRPSLSSHLRGRALLSFFK